MPEPVKRFISDHQCSEHKLRLAITDTLHGCDSSSSSKFEGQTIVTVLTVPTVLELTHAQVWFWNFESDAP